MKNTNKIAKEELYFKNADEWRKWLSSNHDISDGVYLILYKVSSNKRTMRWEEAVRVALCFGWIDSTAKRIDEEKRKQLFTPRKRKSVWSRLNKQHINELTNQGLMHESGLKKIKEAKKDGSWASLDKVEKLIVPDDLKKAFDSNPKAFKNYQSFSKTYRKGYLYWLNQAKRQETRERRIEEIVGLCAENKKSR